MSRPEIVQTIDQLKCEYADDLAVVELNCMAACEDVPAVMLEYDYYPQVTPQELYEIVNASLKQEV